MKSFDRIPAVLAALFVLVPAPVSFSAESRQAATVDQAITGDTVRLKGGKELRYISVDAYPPESKVPLAREYGVKAQEFNQSLVGGKKVLIEWGPKLRDKQNRLLGYVFTENGESVNERIAREGMGKVRVVVPNTRYADELREAQSQAQRERKGIWEKEPPDPRASKSYVGEKNTKIFYFPDSPELDRIPEAQLVTFNSRVDAVAAGYKACFSCRQKGELDEDY